MRTDAFVSASALLAILFEVLRGKPRIVKKQEITFFCTLSQPFEAIKDGILCRRAVSEDAHCLGRWWKNTKSNEGMSNLSDVVHTIAQIMVFRPNRRIVSNADQKRFLGHDGLFPARYEICSRKKNGERLLPPSVSLFNGFQKNKVRDCPG
jgi:hypothetical protein